jgi:hypothetical protein
LGFIPQSRGHGDAREVILTSRSIFRLAIDCSSVERSHPRWFNAAVLAIAGLPWWQAKSGANVIPANLPVVTGVAVTKEAIARWAQRYRK